jgi:hypothetical protein
VDEGNLGADDLGLAGKVFLLEAWAVEGEVGAPGGSTSQRDASMAWPSSVWHTVVVAFLNAEMRAVWWSKTQSG